MSKPWLLDLFCGAGGAGMGYHLAGFRLVGIDINPQPNYPFAFYLGDAMEFPLEGFDYVHASPPCQAYSGLRQKQHHPDLYVATRQRLQAYGAPWAIENIPAAPVETRFILCGSMFGLRVRRHRNFESSVALRGPACDHRAQGTPLGVYGDGGHGLVNRGTKARRKDFAGLMGMEWAHWREVVQGIPPVYTRHIGRQLIRGWNHG